ncbi:MAG: hypothetical protein D6707_01960 [Bacteroidetes bacterium]|nr:MAG: hypothetical protein D6707_01960 [Bacteroidota bacterium]
MAKLKRIGVLSLAKLQAVLMAFVGLIAGISYAIMGATFASLAGSAGLGAGLGFLAIIIFPILYAIFGFIGGAIEAFLYNLVAGWVGGIEMDFEQQV